MYTLLIADDERTIREGIARSIQWNSLGISQIYLAKDGNEAYDIIVEKNPDIVLVDIIMPKMTGIELIDKLSSLYPKMQFIILSGYDNFEFAQKAMQNEVKWYLLKPCTPMQIQETIKEVICHIQEIEEHDNMIQSMRENIERLIPQAKEQFFRDLMLGRYFNNEDFKIYKELFAIKDICYRMVLFKVGHKKNYIELFPLLEVIEEVIGSQFFCLSVIINAYVVMLIDVVEIDRIIWLIKKIQRKYRAHGNQSITAAISEEDYIENAHKMFRELEELIQFEFYLGEGSIITRNDVNIPSGNSYDNGIEIQSKELVIAVKSGNVEKTEQIIEDIFSSFASKRYNIHIVKASIIELYMTILRQCEPEEAENYIKNIILFNEFHTISQLFHFIRTFVLKIAEKNCRSVTKSHDQIIHRVLKYVEENFSNEELNLRYIASKLLYINVDYLGKLFKKKTGVKFTQYLTELRLEKAKKMIETLENDIKIYEIAEAVGFGNNPAYFSQVFKKYTGLTPREYQNRFYRNAN